MSRLAFAPLACLLAGASACAPSPALEAEAVHAGRSADLEDLAAALQPRRLGVGGPLAVLGGEVVVVQADNQSLSWPARPGRPARSLEVGADPVAIAALDATTAVVTLSGERAIAIVEATDDGARVVERIEVGAEPEGLALDLGTERAFVALAGADALALVDLRGGVVVDTIAVPARPRWVRYLPEVGRVAVTGAMSGDLALVDPRSGLVATHRLRGQLSPRFGTPGFEEHVRPTGDMGWDGERLWVPAMVIDTTLGADVGLSATAAVPYYDGGGTGAIPFAPALLVLDVEGSGVGVERASLVTTRTGGLASTLSAVDRVADRVVVSSVVAPRGQRTARLHIFELDPLWTARLPPLVDGQSTVGALSGIASTVAGGTLGVAAASPDQLLAVTDFGNGLEAVVLNERGYLADYRAFELPESQWEQTLRDGRALFHGQSVPGYPVIARGNVSCATCHVDSHTNGLTLEIEVGPRNVPSLEGPISEQGFMTWTSGVPTVADEVLHTSTVRMGGDMDEEGAEVVAAFIERTRHTDHDAAAAFDDAAIARGQALFERADVGCAGCHPAPAYADGARHDLYGEQGVRTPRLVGVALSAPYLHDGRAPTLRAVLESAARGEMGDASMLTERELGDLEAFLRSL